MASQFDLEKDLPFEIIFIFCHPIHSPEEYYLETPPGNLISPIAERPLVNFMMFPYELR